LDTIIAGRQWPDRARVLDFGCGNGILTSWLASKGFNAVGVDLSASGVEIAKEAYPSIRFSTDVSAENIARMGPFELAVCIEVIAHCYDPSTEMKKIFDNLKPGGMLIMATPYHGYLKNLVIAVTGRLDHHLTTLSPEGHVHFFSIATIREFLRKIGFEEIAVYRVGRISVIAKSMIVTAFKPIQ
jgi:2-polyprenyl-6-hydroxyphenyl methylase/3-demethylubiquinone-9 3-methyltransferase